MNHIYYPEYELWQYSLALEYHYHQAEVLNHSTFKTIKSSIEEVFNVFEPGLLSKKSFDVLILGEDAFLNTLLAYSLFLNGKSTLIFQTSDYDPDDELVPLSKQRMNYFSPKIQSFLKKQWNINDDIFTHQQFFGFIENDLLNNITYENKFPKVMFAGNFDIYIDNLSTSFLNNKLNLWPLKNNKPTCNEGLWEHLNNYIPKFNIDDKEERFFLGERTKTSLIDTGMVIQTTPCNILPEKFNRVPVFNIGEALFPINKFRNFRASHRLLDIKSAIAINDLIAGKITPDNLIKTYKSNDHVR